MMRPLSIGIPQRLTLLRTLVTAFLLASILFTYRLWFTQRLFPAAPLVPDLEFINSYSLYISIFACLMLASSLILRWYRLLLFAGLLCLTLLILADYNRITQWTYIYGAALLVLVFYNGRVDDPNRYTSYFIILQLLLCSVYFYTGLHQMQSRFIEQELSEAISPLRGFLSERQFTFILRLGWAIPFMMLFIAISLFITPARYLGITLAILVHLSLTLLLWPLRKGDIAGYLLNLFMVPAVIVLFSGKTRQRYFSPMVLLQRPAFYIVAVGFCIMPAFNIGGRWPDACSANIYTGNRVKVKMVLPPADYLRMPLFVKNFCKPSVGGIWLDHHSWSSYELGMVCSDERPVLEALISQIEFWNRGPVKDMELTLVAKQKLLIMP